MKMLDEFDTKKAAILIFTSGDKFKNARLKRNLDTTGTIKIKEYEPNYIKYISIMEMKVWQFSLKYITKWLERLH
jgi:hypothetical protein